MCTQLSESKWTKFPLIPINIWQFYAVNIIEHVLNDLVLFPSFSMWYTIAKSFNQSTKKNNTLHIIETKESFIEIIICTYAFIVHITRGCNLLITDEILIHNGGARYSNLSMRDILLHRLSLCCGWNFHDVMLAVTHNF